MVNIERVYQSFDRLRLPLIVLVVFIHAQFSIGNDFSTNNAYAHVSYFFSSVISSVAVPLFLFISGCLYFREYKVFSFDVYLNKQKRRIRSLVVPFVAWNALLWMIFTVFYLFAPSIINGGIPSIVGCSIKDFLWVFWGSTSGGPIDFPLWFVRDLITLTFLSPIIYFIFIKSKIGDLLFLLLLCCWVADYPVMFLGNNIRTPLFFFVLGGMANKFWGAKSSSYSLQYLSLVGLRGGQFIILIWLLLCMLLCVNEFYIGNRMLSLYLGKVEILVGLMAMFCVVNISRSFWDKMHNIISGDCVFFIFACHGFLITVMKRIIEKMAIENQVILILLYFFIVVLTIFLCFCLYKVLKTLTPKVLQVLTGR